MAETDAAPAPLKRLAHVAAGRGLVDALEAGDPAAWREFEGLLRSRLDPVERTELARAALLALELPDYVNFSYALAPSHAGTPVPPFDGLAEEAALWADWASDVELKAYATAIFLRMTPRDRQRFVAFALRRSA